MPFLGDAPFWVSPLSAPVEVVVVVVVVVFFLRQLNSFAHTSVGSPNYSD
jgi:hypothetical protein